MGQPPEQPRHGYSILKDIQSMSDGRVQLSTGTFVKGGVKPDHWGGVKVDQRSR